LRFFPFPLILSFFFPFSSSYCFSSFLLANLCFLLRSFSLLLLYIKMHNSVKKELFP
jgi:hypothetical protein